MLSKYCVVLDSDYIVYIVRIVIFQILKNLKFYACLMMESLFVSYDLYCNKLIGFIIIAFQCLAKTTLSKKVQDFISIGKMISQNYRIISSVIVIAIVMGQKRRTFNLLSIQAKEVNLLLFQDFPFLIVCQIVNKEFKCFARSYRVLDLFYLLR